MAENKINNTKNAPRFLRIASGSILIVFALWLAISFATHNSIDFRPPEDKFIYPPPRPVMNWGGPAGAMLSELLFSFFGYLGFIVPLLLLFLGILRIARKPFTIVFRLAGGVIAGHAIIASLFALPGGDISRSISGKYGLDIVSALKSAVGNVMAYLITILLFISFFAIVARLNVTAIGKSSFGNIARFFGWIAAIRRRRAARKAISREDIITEYENKARPSEIHKGITGNIIPGDINKKSEQEIAKGTSTEEPQHERESKATTMEFIPPPITRIDKKAAERLIPKPEKKIVVPPPPPPASMIDPQKIIEELKAKESQKEPITPDIIKKETVADIELPSPILQETLPHISHEPPLPEPAPIEPPLEEVMVLENEQGSSQKLETAFAAAKIQDISLTKYIYTPPSVELLIESEPEPKGVSDTVLQEQALKLMKTLESFGVKGVIKEICPGPVITRYEMEPAEGVKVSRISSLADDIALSLKAQDIRIIAPVPGKGTVGIEVPNDEIQIVRIREILSSDLFKKTEYALPLALGKRVDGSLAIADLSKMPHLLIAGATGSGKSVCINSIITSLAFDKSPVDVRFILIDPKRLELSVYHGIPHLAAPIVVEPKHAAIALNWAVSEMEERYKILSSVGVRSIADYNMHVATKGEESGIAKLPYIIILVDELADLMALVAQEIEEPIARLAQMSRAVGIHLVIATQRPSVDVITGLIKANFPSRIAFKVRSKIDSRTILDMSGAERLLGHGDMLYLPSGYAEPIRIHGSLITTSETEKIVTFLRDFPNPYPGNVLDFEEAEAAKAASGEQDELFWDAAKIVVMYQQGSTSFLQRKLRVGYTRAGCIVDQLESARILGPFQGSKAREVLIKDLESLEKLKEENI